MNKGEAFLKRGEHPPSFVSLLHLLLPFTLSSRFTYYILVWILKHVLLQVRRYKRQNSLKKYYSVFVGGIIYMQFLLFCENTNASSVYKCNTAIASHKRGKHFLLLHNNHWISHTMIWWKMCLLFPRLNGVLPTSLWSVAPSSTSFHDLWLSYFYLFLVEFFA